MSSWHRNNPEHYEQYGEPFEDYAEMVNERRKYGQCLTCGEHIRTGTRCAGCLHQMDEDRMEKESGR